MTNTAYTIKNKVTGEVLSDRQTSYFKKGSPYLYDRSFKDWAHKDLNDMQEEVTILTGKGVLEGEAKQTYISQLEVVEVEWGIKEVEDGTD